MENGNAVFFDDGDDGIYVLCDGYVFAIVIVTVNVFYDEIVNANAFPTRA
ncbi:MAG: hypothetical protein Hyperionvirus18_28 [Hyperionvirus sp.]|uniref:Uncharacterized protein n=1 Tax=Hyperionvirus sp. TaxID=2487770 RepID=A0A3G5AAL8_9VIRU|nr:MAG: hypothetical protein Hyperionvirus18_28 [Hyperionvirus sp.]